MSEPDLSRYYVVLCRAEEAGNVGSACRAMKTMGLTRLVLAGCPDFDDARVRMLAVHAADVYEGALRVSDLASALAPSALSGSAQAGQTGGEAMGEGSRQLVLQTPETRSYALPAAVCLCLAAALGFLFGVIRYKKQR